MTSEQFNKSMRVIATILVVGQGFYYAFTQPGIMDTVNGLITGTVIYALWFAKERKHPNDEILKLIAEGKIKGKL